MQMTDIQRAAAVKVANDLQGVIDSIIEIGDTLDAVDSAGGECGDPSAVLGLIDGVLKSGRLSYGDLSVIHLLICLLPGARTIKEHQKSKTDQ